MRINNNVTAMNTHRMYTSNNNSVSKSVSKLSSGYRINSSADDAAGLAISEKMRAQIRGLTMASKNSQDAVSLVQTAEGALQETHNILQRMRELAVQSGNDTNETSIDRGALNAEFQQLKAEIDEIASTTRFNDQNLIDGTFSKYKYSAENEATGVSNILIGNANAGTYTLEAYTRIIGAETGSETTFSADKGSASNASAASFDAAGIAAENTDQFNDKFTLSFGSIDSTDPLNLVATFKLTGTDGATYTGTVALGTAVAAGDELEIDFGELGTLTITTVSGLSADATDDDLEAFNGVTLSGSGGAADVAGTTKAYMKLGEEEVEVFAGDKEVEFRSAGVTLKLSSALTQAEVEGTGLTAAYAGDITITQTKGQSMVIQTGANEGDNLAINLNMMNTKLLGIYTSSIETREKASSAITYVNAATNLVSTQRAELGALANRLEHKIANLDTSAENLTAAESRIRDVDMASEMTNFTKNNILAQASTAMLAQANALPQGVLQLLG